LKNFKLYFMGFHAKLPAGSLLRLLYGRANANCFSFQKAHPSF